MGCPDWNKIKAEYIAGGTSYRKLAEKHGVPRTTLERKAKEEKWTDLRRQANGKAEAKIVDSVSEKQASRASKIIDVADMLLDKIAEFVMVGVSDTQGLKHISSALKDLKEIKGFKSELDLREQEARIAKLLREAEASNEESQEITVTILGDADAYSK